MSWHLIALSLVVLNEPITVSSPVKVVPVPKTLGIYQDKATCKTFEKIARSEKPKHIKVKCVEVTK